MFNEKYTLILYKDNTETKQQAFPNYNCNLDGSPYEDDDLYTRNYEDESSKRAYRTILEYAMNNQFQYFMTWTFDADKLDREDYELAKKKLLKAVNNYNRDMNTKLSYVITPELHKETNGIHFHALMNGFVKDDLVSVYDQKHQRWVYYSNYFFERFGRNTVIKIKDYNKFVAYYISKYVRKDDLRIFKRRYFVSNGLGKALKLYKGSYEGLFNDQSDTYILDNFVRTFKGSMCEIYELSEEAVDEILSKSKGISDCLPF